MGVVSLCLYLVDITLDCKRGGVGLGTLLVWIKGMWVPGANDTGRMGRT